MSGMTRVQGGGGGIPSEKIRISLPKRERFSSFLLRFSNELAWPSWKKSGTTMVVLVVPCVTPRSLRAVFRVQSRMELVLGNGIFRTALEGQTH